MRGGQGQHPLLRPCRQHLRLRQPRSPFHVLSRGFPPTAGHGRPGSQMLELQASHPLELAQPLRGPRAKQVPSSWCLFHLALAAGLVPRLCPHGPRPHPYSQATSVCSLSLRFGVDSKAIVTDGGASERRDGDGDEVGVGDGVGTGAEPLGSAAAAAERTWEGLTPLGEARLNWGQGWEGVRTRREAGSCYLI